MWGGGGHKHIYIGTIARTSEKRWIYQKDLSTKQFTKYKDQQTCFLYIRYDSTLSSCTVLNISKFSNVNSVLGLQKELVQAAELQTCFQAFLLLYHSRYLLLIKKLAANVRWCFFLVGGGGSA